MKLNPTIREVLDEYDDTDPALLADIVIGRIPDYDMGSVLRHLMTSYVATFMSRTRTGATPPASSAKVSAVRDEYESWLRERISVAPNTYRMLGDCSPTDLRYAASLRREIATKNAVAAEQFDALADALDEAGAGVVRDLPPQFLATVAKAA
jgi:hypothetical protein